MKKVVQINIFATILFLITVLIVIPLFLIYSIDIVSYDKQPGFFGSQKLTNDYTLTQELYVDRNNFTGFGISIKNPNQLNKNDIDIVVLDKYIPIRKVKVSGENIEDGSYQKIVFEPIADSGDKHYLIQFKTAGTENFNAFEIFTTKEKSRFLGNLYLNSQLVENRSLAINSLYEMSNRYDEICRIFQSLISIFSKDFKFAIFYSIVIFSLCIFIVRKK